MKTTYDFANNPVSKLIPTDEYKDEEKVISQIERQASHIMRMYENEELEDKMIELAREWFFKGLMTGINHGKK